MTKVLNLLLVAVFATFLATPLRAQSLPTTSPARAGFSPERLERMHATLRGFVDEGKHAGYISLLARDGRIVDFQTYGYRDLEGKLPMEKDTICRIYSMSKIVTSVAVLILHEEGKFNLDDPAGNYLPALKGMKVMNGGSQEKPLLVEARPITIKHLLTHTSGLIYDFDGNTSLNQLYQRANLWESSSLPEFISRVGKLHLKHQPGEAFSYGINTDVLGALVEQVSGKSFEEFLRERIFVPLKMKDTSFDVPAEKMHRVAKTYRHGPDGKLAPAEPLLGTWPEPGRGIASGGAGLFSTVGDYARFAQMLLNGGQLDGARILGRKTVEFMTTNHLTALPTGSHAFNPAMGFGLGVEVRIDSGKAAFVGSLGQFGWYGAATTYCQIDPKEKLVAILFVQHFPYNQHGMFAKFATGYYQALE
ncbi:MAG: serine hydrolase domain-containing protein [Verrucomicrobiota bacterium]